MRTPLKFVCDFYKKRVEYDESGQSEEIWTLERTVRCHFMPLRQEERTVGRVQNPRTYWVWLDEKDSDLMDYSNQVRDLRDREGNMIDEGSFNIIGIKRYAGWSKLHHLQLHLQKVLD